MAHVRVRKLRQDRCLPLHPQLVALIDADRATHVDPASPLLLPRENGRPADRHAVTRWVNKAGAAAGLTHIHPHQLRHTLATQAINRGMSLEAIAAMLGHRSLDMTLRYARIASRTVADEYFAVTDKIDALYGPARVHSRPFAGAYRSSSLEPAAAVRRGLANRGAPQAGRWCHRVLG